MTGTDATGYAVSNLKAIKPLLSSGIAYHKVSEGSEEEYQDYKAMMEDMLKLSHAVPPDLSNNPAYKDYARVVVDGQVVATLDNNGFATMSGGVAGKVGDTLPGSINGAGGPVLAQARAEIIAKAMGGTVAVAPTAMTQEDWARVPTPRLSYDEAAINADPIHAQLQALTRDRAAFLAQQLAQQDEALSG
jgi:hypothetical protein